MTTDRCMVICIAFFAAASFKDRPTLHVCVYCASNTYTAPVNTEEVNRETLTVKKINFSAKVQHRDVQYHDWVYKTKPIYFKSDAIFVLECFYASCP